MRIDIMTLFPDSVSHVLGESIIGRAAKKGIIEINCVQIRDFTENRQMQDIVMENCEIQGVLVSCIKMY